MGCARKRRRSQRDGVQAEKWERWQLLTAMARIAAVVMEFLDRDHFRL